MMAAVFDSLYLAARHWREMRDHVQQLTPQEACGLVAGIGASAHCVFPITNRLYSPTRYEMEPNELLIALQAIDEHRWELLAIYHAHPNGPPYPSELDLTQVNYPQAACLIWSPDTGDGWQCRAFTIKEGEATPLKLIVTRSID
jgi:[CysO sulfur-carrier protein]-S-L-cysteine hydrolase